MIKEIGILLFFSTFLSVETLHATPTEFALKCKLRDIQGSVVNPIKDSRQLFELDSRNGFSKHLQAPNSNFDIYLESNGPDADGFVVYSIDWQNLKTHNHSQSFHSLNPPFNRNVFALHASSYGDNYFMRLDCWYK